MNAELRTILEHVPEDLPVVLAGLGHITQVTRRVSPAGCLVLSDSPGREPDDYRLTGPFRRRPDLVRRLDPDAPAEEDRAQPPAEGGGPSIASRPARIGSSR